MPLGYKLTQEDYSTVGADRVKWIGTSLPQTARTKTLWECLHCHAEFTMDYNHIQQGRGCALCNRRAAIQSRRLTEDDYRTVGLDRGIHWIGKTLPVNNHAKTTWTCGSHVWEQNHNNISNGSGCPVCAGKQRITVEQITAIAKAASLTWVGEVLPKAHEKTAFRCNKCRRIVYKTYAATKYRNTGCRSCSYERSGRKLRIGKEQYQRLIEEKGYTIIGEIPDIGSTKVTLRCFYNHEWIGSYHNIKGGNGCPYCAQKAPKIEEDYLNVNPLLAWVAAELPRNVHEPTRWQCKTCLGRFEATFHSIGNHGTGCPHCQDIVNGVRVSKLQRELADLLNGALNHPAGKYKVDVALLQYDGLKLAVEFDEAHWHHDRIEKDLKRAHDLIAQGWHVLSIKASDRLPSEAIIMAGVKALRAGSTYHEIVHISWFQYLAKNAKKT